MFNRFIYPILVINIRTFYYFFLQINYILYYCKKPKNMKGCSRRGLNSWPLDYETNALPILRHGSPINYHFQNQIYQSYTFNYKSIYFSIIKFNNKSKGKVNKKLFYYYHIFIKFWIFVFLLIKDLNCLIMYIIEYKN